MDFDILVRVVTGRVFCKLFCFLGAPTFSNSFCLVASSYINGAERRVRLLVVGSGSEISAIYSQSVIPASEISRTYLLHLGLSETSFRVLQQPLRQIVVVIAAFADGVGEDRMHDSIQGRYESGSFLNEIKWKARTRRVGPTLLLPSHNFYASRLALVLRRTQPPPAKGQARLLATTCTFTFCTLITFWLGEFVTSTPCTPHCLSVGGFVACVARCVIGVAALHCQRPTIIVPETKPES